MKFQIRDIRPNPFRDIDRYPIRPDKIAALRASIHQTGFWDNIVARLDPDGLPEIAYGHHRLEALRAEYPDGAYEVDLIIRDLDDETMLRIMAHENMGEWGTTAEIVHETVRAVILAYAEGRIDLDEPGEHANRLRHAPHFGTEVVSTDTTRPYTAETVASFLGWLTPSGQAPVKVKDALHALALVEDGIIAPNTFDGLSPTAAHGRIAAARSVVEARRKAAAQARADAEAAAVDAQRARDAAAGKRKTAQAEAKAAAAQARADAAARAAEVSEAEVDEAALKSAAETAIEEAAAESTTRERVAAAKVVELPEPPTDYNAQADQTARMLTAYLEVPTGVGPRLERLIEHRDELNGIPRTDLGLALSQLADRLLDARKRLLDGIDDDDADYAAVRFQAAA